MADPQHFAVLNGTVGFDGNCEATKPYCGAMCCRVAFVLLTAEERASGKYKLKTPTKGCNCEQCKVMRRQGLAALPRSENGCIYLDGNNACTIYEYRPQMCRDFICQDRLWDLTLSEARRKSDTLMISPKV